LDPWNTARVNSLYTARARERRAEGVQTQDFAPLAHSSTHSLRAACVGNARARLLTGYSANVNASPLRQPDYVARVMQH
jgi:hypothetical protein